MMVYYKKLRDKEAAGRDGAMTQSVQGCPLVLNLKLRWVFNTTQSCSERVVIVNETGNLHKKSAESPSLVSAAQRQSVCFT